jgi:acetyl-CoA carboxylase biotin carboxyl carrier protein
MGKAKQETSVFDVKQVRELIELMEAHDLNEVDLKQADQRIRLRRGGEGPVTYAAAPAPVAQAPAAVAAPTPAAGAAAAPAPAADDNTELILSPTIGTYYSRPKPDAPEFLKVGDSVTPDTIICLVEAMKMFNEIPAGVSGTIVEILVKNEQAVHVDMPLFRITKG